MAFCNMITDMELDHRFHQIIEQHKGVLFKVARIYCHNEEDRKDLVQEIMIQVWRSLHKYNDNFAITTWLYRISLNVAISFYRKNVTRQSFNIPLIEEFASIKDEAGNEKQERLNHLELFISQLNELDKALMLLYLEDKSHVEISEIMGLSVSNIGTKIGRIKEKLRSKFSQLNSK
jgi:RNA polymerase sigma factor (sigma-70 family)